MVSGTEGTNTHSLLPQLQEGLPCTAPVSHTRPLKCPPQLQREAVFVACVGRWTHTTSLLVLMEQPGSAAPGSPSALGNHLCFVSSLLIIYFPRHLAPFAVHGGQVLGFCPLIGLGEDSFTQNYIRFFFVCVSQYLSQLWTRLQNIKHIKSCPSKGSQRLFKYQFRMI